MSHPGYIIAMVEPIKTKPVQKGPPKPSTADDVARWLASGRPEDFKVVRQRMDPIVDTALKSFAGDDQAYRIQAYRLMQDALRTWNPSSGAAPETHVYNRLRELQRVKGDREYILNVPERQRVVQSGISRFSSEFEQENGREPTMDEVSEGMGVDRKTVLKARGAPKLVPESAISSAAAEEGSPGKGLEIPDDPGERWTEYVYDELGQDKDHRGQFILERWFGFGGHPRMTQTDIAHRLKISIPAVNKRIGVLDKRLRENQLLRGQ